MLNRLKSTEKFGSILACSALYKIAIELVYIYNIAPSFSYMYLTADLNFAKSIISWILFISVLFALFYHKKRIVSQYILYLLLLLIYTPAISYYWLNDQSTYYAAYLTLSFIILNFFSRLKMYDGNSISFPRKYQKVILKIFAILCVILSVVVIRQRGGIDIRAFNLSKIYLVRASENMSGIASYMKNWIPKIFFPFFFIYFLQKKKYICLSITIVIELMLYMSFANKGFLFSIVWAALLYICCCSIHPYRMLVNILSLSTCLAYFLSSLGFSQTLRNVLPYRLLFIPAQIQYQYYNFFCAHPKVHFSEGLIGKIIGTKNIYGGDIAFFIGNLYSPDGTASHSNTGVFADAYYNAGFFGMLIVSCIAGVLIGLYDNYKNTNATFIIVSVSYVVFSLADTGLHTTMLTGGMIINLLLLKIYDAKTKNKLLLNNKCL